MNGHPPPQQKQITVSEDTMKGRYTNQMQIGHTKEEFVMDFFFLTPQGGSLLARLVTNPGHMKRIYKAFEENLKKYEEKFGKIEISEEKDISPGIGFQQQG